jgi:hypothetical protein
MNVIKKTIELSSFKVVPLAADWFVSEMMSPIFQAFAREMKFHFGDNWDGATHDYRTGIYEVRTKDGKKMQFEVVKTKNVPLETVRKYPFIDAEEKWRFKQVICDPLGCEVYFCTYINKDELLKDMGVA